MRTKVIGILLAFLAAIFYSLSTPISKLLTEEVSPVLGALLSFIILKEELGINYIIGLVLMIGGSILVVIDTLSQKEDLSLK
ncbi:MAG: hypothetical protein PUB23_04805 [Bacilli bacterium]|nr:hypothetical protein [Bacilli bacterium]